MCIILFLCRKWIICSFITGTRMVNIDWKTFMGIKPEDMTEVEKDNLYETAAWYNPDNSIDKKYLIQLVRVIQEILKFKAEQVESLTNELDDIAARQGKEEGSKLQQYIDEIEQLRDELEYQKKANRSSSRSTYASNEDLKREMVKLEIENEELLRELKEREKDLVNEKEEVERYASQVASLEREKQELSRELRALQDETSEKNFRNLRNSLELGVEKQEEMTEIVRQKNKHISQLLEDIDMIENENISLRTKLASVRDELSETTSNMTEITSELSKLKHLNEEYRLKNVESDNKIQGLITQIEELVEEKAKCDKELDEYILMFKTKLQEWKDAVLAKDEEIIKLKKEIKKLGSSVNEVTGLDLESTKMSTQILEQEKQIKVLQEELQRATDEINSSAELIERLKQKQLKLNSFPLNSQSVTAFFEEKIKVLEEKLQYAEEDAQAKAEEMSNLVIQLREYESGVFGLSEAVARIKKLEKNLEEKDLQIEKLVEICNNLEMELDNFEEQNLSLRERLGFSASDDLDTAGIKFKFKEKKEFIEKLKLELDKKEEELVKVKIKYRKLFKYLKMTPTDWVKYSPDMCEDDKHLEVQCVHEQKLGFKLQMLVKENDALRKGMHEILESIREQICSGTVTVQSACLERLLEALDSRHVSGWYHPAMRLQAQLNTEEGKNEELRNQIRSLKMEERKRASELENAYRKIENLESLPTPRLEENKMIQKELPEEVKTAGKNDVNDKLQLTYVSHSQRIIELEIELRSLKVMLDGKKMEFERLEETAMREKESLLTKVAELECQIREFNNQSLDPNITKTLELTSKVLVLERKVNFLKNSEHTLKEINEKLREEIIEGGENMLRDILKLQNEKSELLSRVENLEKIILDTVSKEKFSLVSKELVNLKTKYQNAVSLALVKNEEDSSEKLRTEIRILENERETILGELKVVKEKLIVAEGLLNEESVTKGDFDNQISVLASKLAASEVREFNEKQKSAHLEKINEILKSQQDEVEIRNKELLAQVTKLTEENEVHRATERDLRMKASNLFSEEETPVLLMKIETLEKKCRELMLEKDNIQELFEISQGQCRTLQEWKDEEKILLASQTEQILVLQSSDDDKAVISRLSHELAMAKLMTAQLSKKNSDLKMNMTKLLAQNLNLEVKVGEKCREFFEAERKHVALVEYLYEAMDEVRKSYGSGMRFRDIEMVYRLKVELREKNEEMKDKIEKLKAQMHEYSVKKEEMEMELENLEDLKLALKGDNKNLVSWHNRSTELRLQEARCRRKNEFLVGEVSQLENCLKTLNKEIAALEEENMKREGEWEQKQRLWEETQLQMCRILKKTRFKNGAEKLYDASTNTEYIVQDIDDNTSKYQDQERLKHCEWKVKELEAEVVKLKQEGKEKEEIILVKEELLNNIKEKPRIVETGEIPEEEKIENAEKEALKVTVDSLQNIIQQKEETIVRYQNLLKEGREEYSRACGKLQEELRNLNETLTVQSKAYNKLKNAVQTNHFTNENIPAVVEKYITRIHELEEELRECQMNLTSISTQAYTTQKEVEKWKNLATERLLMMDDVRQRVESDFKKEFDNYRNEIDKYQKEIEHLNRIVEEGFGGNSSQGKLEQPVQQLQVRLFDHENDQFQSKSDQLSDCTFDKPQKQKNGKFDREVELLRRQLKSAKDESNRLREQIRLLQSRAQKRPKTAGSSTTRSDSRSSVREENLTTKIKNLEELLTVSKEREKEIIEINQKKLKSTEEVARWDERKKNQQTIENLSLKLKEKEAEVEVLKTKNESFRNIVYKCERDKSLLESQLKAYRGGVGGTNHRIEKLTTENSQLKAEIETLERKLEEQMRHSGTVGAALLQEKLESQERKLVTFELASRGQSAIIEELERLKTLNSNLEKFNLKLESENLALRFKLEKEKTETNFALNTVKQFKETKDEVLEVSKGTIRSKAYNLGSSKKKLIKSQVSRVAKSDQCHHGSEQKVKQNEGSQTIFSPKSRILRRDTKAPRTYKLLEKDLFKLREDHTILRAKYKEAMEKNIKLEEELKSCRYQIHLMEEKDLAEALTRTSNLQTSELCQELIQVKAKLEHKTHLLNRVKTLLMKTVAKEKALLHKVNFLQALVPDRT